MTHSCTLNHFKMETICTFSKGTTVTVQFSTLCVMKMCVADGLHTVGDLREDV